MGYTQLSHIGLVALAGALLLTRSTCSGPRAAELHSMQTTDAQIHIAPLALHTLLHNNNMLTLTLVLHGGGSSGGTYTLGTYYKAHIQ